MDALTGGDGQLLPVQLQVALQLDELHHRVTVALQSHTQGVEEEEDEADDDDERDEEEEDEEDEAATASAASSMARMKVSIRINPSSFVS